MRFVLHKSQANEKNTLHQSLINSQLSVGNHFTIHSTQSKEYVILDKMGKQVSQGELSLGENRIGIEPQMTNGIYFIKTQNGTHKLVINR